MKPARYTEQFPFVGTTTHRSLIEGTTVAIEDAKAPIMRFALDLLYGLDDGELRPGDTVEAAVQRVANKMRPSRRSEESEASSIV